MKKQFFLISSVAILAFAACNDSSTTSDTKKDTTTTNAGDSTIQTTTTTTTTKTFHPISNFEHRTFYNVKTKKPVKLRMDTVLHYYVDVTTNQQPDYIYYDPSTKDTFDYYGRRLNNALMNNNGDYTIDESRLATDNSNQSADTSSTMSTDNSSSSSSNMNNSKTKMKQKDDKTKIKTKNDK